MKAKYIPNIITLMRLILIVPFFYFLINSFYDYAFYIFLIAGLSDGLDGILARKFQWITQLGSFLDPLADKLLIFTSFSTLAYLEKVPLWLFGIIFLRDIVIMTGVGCVYLFVGDVEFEPSKISKLNTVLQVLLVACLLFELAFALFPIVWIHFLIACTVFTTITSMVNYVWVWSWYTYRAIQKS